MIIPPYNFILKRPLKELPAQLLILTIFILVQFLSFTKFIFTFFEDDFFKSNKHIIYKEFSNLKECILIMFIIAFLSDDVVFVG